MTETNGAMVRLGGLWKKQGRDGATYFSGKLGAANLLIFENRYKKEERDPDYIIFVAKPREERPKAEVGGERSEDVPF